MDNVSAFTGDGMSMRIKLMSLLLIVTCCMFTPALADDLVIEGFDTLDWDSSFHNDAQLQIYSAIGIDNNSLALDFKLSSSGHWVQIDKDFSLDNVSNLMFSFYAKNIGQPVSIEFKLLDGDGTNFGKRISLSNKSWQKISIPFTELSYFWGGDKNFNNLRKIYFAISSNTPAEGVLYLDKLSYQILPLKEDKMSIKQLRFEFNINKNHDYAEAAAKWIKKQQNNHTGLILSYIGDEKPYAWSYDQALALLVLSMEDIAAAQTLASAISKLQNADGSWFDGYMADTAKPATDNKWIGSVSWLIYAFRVYENKTDDNSFHTSMMKASNWLKSLQDKSGKLHVSTEGNLDAWWALSVTGFTAEANKLKDYLLSKIWDNDEGRMLTGTNDRSFYLDPQSWGSAFLRAVNENDKALKALTAAYNKLSCSTKDGKIKGLDTAGPFTVWNEGTCQWISLGGYNADNLLREMEKIQNSDGSLNHSEEKFTEGNVWHVTWHAVAPTAWFYFAETSEPFDTMLIKTNLLDIQMTPDEWKTASDNNSVVSINKDDLQSNGILLDYDLGAGHWVSVYNDIAPFSPDNAYTSFEYQGDGRGAISYSNYSSSSSTKQLSNAIELELKLVDIDGSVFCYKIPDANKTSAINKVRVPLSRLEYLYGGNSELNGVKRIEFAISGEPSTKGFIHLFNLAFTR